MGMSAAHCQGIVREMSGNFRVSGEWSPCVFSATVQLMLSFSVLLSAIHTTSYAVTDSRCR